MASTPSGPRWFRTTWSRVVDSLMGQILLRGVLLRGNPPLRHGRRHLDDPRFLAGDHEAFFGPLPPPAEFIWSDADLTRMPPEQLAEDERLFRVRDFTFPSVAPLGIEPSDHVIGRCWTPKNDDRGVTVVGVDGIVHIGSGWFHRLARRLAPQGIETVMMDAPLNFRRTPPGSLPGQLLLSGDLSHQLETARQGVLDLATVCRTLQKQGRRVGLVGCSYGGWLISLTATYVNDLEFAIALAPPADLADLLVSRSVFVKAIERGLRSGPELLPELETATRPIRPGLWPLRLPADRFVLHGARFDQFVPPQSIENLAKTWSCEQVWHDEAHYRLTILDWVQSQVADQITAFAGAAER